MFSPGTPEYFRMQRAYTFMVMTRDGVKLTPRQYELIMETIRSLPGPMTRKKHSKTARAKISNGLKNSYESDPALRKKRGRPWGEEKRRRLSETLRKMWSNLELRESQAERMREIWKNPEYRKKCLAWRLDPEKVASHEENLSKALRGKKKTPEHLAAISRALKQKPKSPEHRRKLSEAAKNRKKVICPHCGLEGGPGAMTRHIRKCESVNAD